MLTVTGFAALPDFSRIAAGFLPDPLPDFSRIPPGPPCGVTMLSLDH